MPRKRRNFQRPLGNRSYKKLFVVATEGFITEPQYFAILNDMSQSIVAVKCLRKKSTKSSPMQVLEKMKNHLQKESLKKTDEAWIVVDKDDWPKKQIQELHQWEKRSDNYHLALSNPNFEYWLLLHFENGNKIRNANECWDRLKKLRPNYNKDFDKREITLKRVKQAIERAKQRDIHQYGNTTVYILVERVLLAHFRQLQGQKCCEGFGNRSYTMCPIRFIFP